MFVLSRQGGLHRTVTQEFGVVSSNYLPYVSILPVFSVLQSHVKDIEPSRKLDAQRKIRHGVGRRAPNGDWKRPASHGRQA